MDKVTLVMGASPNPDRFSFEAIRSLQRRNMPVIAIGRKDVDRENLKIRKGMPVDIGVVHTIALYMNAKIQKAYYNYILSLRPERIIFNPGATNPELAEKARREGIEVVNDCMLVMLNAGRF